jgi:hypothetical protein
VASGSAVSCTTGGSTSAIEAAINCLAHAMLALQLALASSPSQKCLDHADIDILLEEVGGETVPQRVR